jgi:hypothetical protein
MQRAQAAGNPERRSPLMTIHRPPRAWLRLVVGAVVSAWETHDDDEDDDELGFTTNESVGEFEFDGELEPAIEGGVGDE